MPANNSRRGPQSRRAMSTTISAAAAVISALALAVCASSTRQASQATGQALVNLLNRLTHAGQASAAAGYVPLPTSDPMPGT